MLNIEDYTPSEPVRPLEIGYGVLADGKFYLLEDWLKNQPKPTRWSRFKRRWSDRLDRVADAWAVLSGNKRAIDDDDY